MLTIGYVSAYNPFIDKRAWSGIIYKTREAIENAGFNVKWIRISPSQYALFKIKTLLKIRYGFTQNHPKVYAVLSKYTDWATANECDILFFPGNAQIMQYSPINKEYVYFADACFNQMVDYYWHNVNKKYVKSANEAELWAITHAVLNIRTSDWAKDCAINFYNGNPKRNFVLEFGANLDKKDICESSIYTGEQLNILFSGVDWKRKGGKLAVDTVHILREKYGLNATLTIAGIKSLPKNLRNLDYIINLGFLNKNIPEQYDTYISAIKNSHIFLLPTKAECAGIVFSEASAYGLPIFTHDTGGIKNYVINGMNGYRLKLGSTAKDFADAIHNSIMSNELSLLHNGALKMYSEKLNWDKWGERFEKIIRENILESS